VAAEDDGMNANAPATAMPAPVSRWYDSLLEAGVIPDAIVRLGIRRICAARLREQRAGGVGAQQARFERLVQALAGSAMAVHTDEANAQHYEVPAAFYQHVLGPHLKYSSAWWPPVARTLDEAERAMLDLTATRALLRDGQDILELGCGWGSLTLHMARTLPRARIVAVSNSASQRAHIERIAELEGLRNVRVVTADVQRFDVPAASFDRVVSVEMFEHVRNHRRLLANIRRWLRPDGVLFVHVFAHVQFAYLYEVRDGSDWMAQHFFTGGIMPSLALLPRYQEHLALESQWVEDGTHYGRTAEAWLANMDANWAAIEPVFARTYGVRNVTRWRARWRVFFMACAELFNYDHGQQWVVAHYRFRRGED
jgi:cyclopropane-fatty-acyl-phospholipid synthase